MFGALALTDGHLVISFQYSSCKLLIIIDKDLRVEGCPPAEYAWCGGARVLANFGEMWLWSAGPMQRRSMAAVFANLPCKVLWQLSPKEVPNAAALAEMRIGNNTKVQDGWRDWFSPVMVSVMVGSAACVRDHPSAVQCRQCASPGHKLCHKLSTMAPGCLLRDL